MAHAHADHDHHEGHDHGHDGHDHGHDHGHGHGHEGHGHGHEGHGHGHEGHDHGHEGQAHAPEKRGKAGHAHGGHGHDHGGHGHDHAGHGHDHGPLPEPGTSAARALTIGLLLNAVFVVVEIGAGLWAKSTALLADALHNLGDVGGLALALGAAWLARRAATAKRTYGFRRSTLLAGLANAALIFASVGVVLWEAAHQLRHPPAVNGKLVMAVAAAGVLVNGVSALLLLRSQGSAKDVNVRGAFLHLAGDAAISAGVVVSGLVIAFTGWSLVDPLTSIVISLVVLVATWRLLRDSLDLVLDAVPGDLATADVAAALRGAEGVKAVHDLHIWATSSTQTALTAHLVVDEAAAPGLVLRLSRGLEEKFGISHVTLQVEREGEGETHCTQGDGCLG